MYTKKTVLEQEYDRISRTDLAGKTTGEITEFVRAKTTYTRVLSSIQYKLDALNMSEAELKSETHRSKRLGRYMQEQGLVKPGNGFAAHAIVAGTHQRSSALRVQMAIRKIRIDDTDNGCWLPRQSKDAIGTIFPNAVPHNRIHNGNYFDWLSRSALRVTPNTTEREFRLALNRVRRNLQTGAVSGRVLKKQR